MKFLEAITLTNKHVSTFSRLLPIREREMRNEKSFLCVRVDISNDISLQENYEKETISRGTHRIYSLKMKHV